MTIINADQLINALGNNSSRLVIDKASIANAVAGGYQSLFRATGQPGQGNIPTTAAICNKAIVGTFQWPNQTNPVTTYMGYLFATSSNSAMVLEIHDRLIHNGGLVLNVTTSQTTNLPLDLLTLAVPADRIGDSNYSDIQWWLEVYADGGGTASNATINVTYNNGTTGNLNVVAVGGTLRASRMLSLNSLVPTPGLFIRGINSVILSASTTVAGNFGFTATRIRGTLPMPLANKTEVADWAFLGLPAIPNDSALFPVVLSSTTSTGTLRGGGKLAHG